MTLRLLLTFSKLVRPEWPESVCTGFLTALHSTKFNRWLPSSTRNKDKWQHFGNRAIKVLIGPLLPKMTSLFLEIKRQQMATLPTFTIQGYIGLQASFSCQNCSLMTAESAQAIHTAIDGMWTVTSMTLVCWKLGIRDCLEFLASLCSLRVKNNFILTLPF